MKTSASYPSLLRGAQRLRGSEEIALRRVGSCNVEDIPVECKASIREDQCMVLQIQGMSGYHHQHQLHTHLQ